MDIAAVPTEDARALVHTALIVTCGIGSALTVAVLCAAWAAVSPESLAWVTAHAGQGFLGLLRLLLLVSVAILLYRLAVTYLHLGYGRHTIVRRGEHRPATADRRRAGATYAHRTVAP